MSHPLAIAALESAVTAQVNRRMANSVSQNPERRERLTEEIHAALEGEYHLTPRRTGDQEGWEVEDGCGMVWTPHERCTTADEAVRRCLEDAASGEW